MKLLSVSVLLVLMQFAAFAQEGSYLNKGRRYVALKENKIFKLEKLTNKHQQRWLRKLSRQENRWLKKLKKQDSTSYARAISNSIRFDSIQKALNPDSVTLAKFRRKNQPAIDSLKKISGFIAVSAPGADIELLSNSEQLSDVQARLNYQQYLNGMIEQRGRELKDVANSATGKLRLPVGLDKQLFYGKAKLKAYKNIANEPSKAEERALEYLQGLEGFDQAFAQQPANSMQNTRSAEDLEKMGFQTKRSLNTHLQQKFGGNLSGLQQQMGDQVKQFQDQATKLQAPVSNVKKQVQGAKQSIAETKQTLVSATKADKPSFKINPMRGLPLSKRIEKGYSWNTQRASSNGTRPAILELAAMAGFKHTPSLTYGIGLSTSIGLGQDWNNIRFSMQGLSLRSFATWNWQYGIGAYAGYERTVTSIGNFRLRPETYTKELPSNHSNESIMLGLTKSYKINSRWNGAIQVLYDIWWKEKGLNSPIILRFTTKS